MGGDECPKDYWKRSEFCQQLIKQKGLKDEHELQSYFINTIEKYLNSKGRQIIGWDEILEGGVAPNASAVSISPVWDRTSERKRLSARPLVFIAFAMIMLPTGISEVIAVSMTPAQVMIAVTRTAPTAME